MSASLAQSGAGLVPTLGPRPGYTENVQASLYGKIAPGRTVVRRVRAASLATLLTLVAAGRPVAAQEPAPTAAAQTAQDRRTALYGEGVDAATAGRWADARDRFRAALAIRSSPKVLFSLAQAEEQLGQVASAQADYRRALEGAKAAAESDVVAASEQAQRAIEPRVPHVRVVVSGASGAVATLDEQPIAVGSPVATDPGAHRIVVSAPGTRAVTTSVAIGERQKLDVPVRLEAVAPSPAGLETVPVATTRAVPWRTIGLAMVGTGAVGLGVGAVFGFVAKSKNDQSNRSGCDGDNCTAAAAAVRHDALNAASASTVAFVVGGVLAAGGVVLWLVAPSDADHAVGMTPVALGGGGGLVVTARWR